MTMVKRGIWSRVVSLPHGGVFPQSKIRQGIELRRIVAQANSIQKFSADTRESGRYLIRSVEEIDKEIINDADMSWTIQDQRKRTYSSPQILALMRLRGLLVCKTRTARIYGIMARNKSGTKLRWTKPWV
jgi:hypothetical protein